MPLTSSITNREIIVEVAYSVGCDAFVGSQPGIAVQWLERAVEQMQTIAAHQSQASCPENLDLHVRHALGKYLIL